MPWHWPFPSHLSPLSVFVSTPCQMGFPQSTFNSPNGSSFLFQTSVISRMVSALLPLCTVWTVCMQSPTARSSKISSISPMSLKTQAMELSWDEQNFERSMLWVKEEEEKATCLLAHSLTSTNFHLEREWVNHWVKDSTFSLVTWQRIHTLKRSMVYLTKECLKSIQPTAHTLTFLFLYRKAHSMPWDSLVMAGYGHQDQTGKSMKST